MSDNLSSPTGAGLTSRLAAQARKWAGGERVRVEDVLAAEPALADDPGALLDLIYHEVILRERTGERPTEEEYAVRFPALADQLRLLFEVDRLVASRPGAGGVTTIDHAAGDGQLTGPHPGPSPAPHADGPNLIHGRYVIGEEIARGGMGVVYRATDRVFEREVAVKLLQDGLVGTSSVGRFFAEAKLTGQLQHPAIPPVHDLGTLPDGRPFLAMKLIDGDTLSDRLKNRKVAAEDLNEFLGAFEQICYAVAYAHSKGVIHRDLKPANVMVGRFGEVQVMDWGLAKRLERGLPQQYAVGLAATLGYFAGREMGIDPEGLLPAPGSPDLTRAGTIMGTPAFMPPEQANGELDRVDTRSDVFSLGAILCVILTGRPPYVGATPKEVWRKAASADLTDAHRRLAEWNQLPALVELARKCLDPDPEKRPGHAGEVRVAASAARERIENRKRVTKALDAKEGERSAEVLAKQLLAKTTPMRSTGGEWRRLTGCLSALAILAVLGVVFFVVLGLVSGRR